MARLCNAGRDSTGNSTHGLEKTAIGQIGWALPLLPAPSDVFGCVLRGLCAALSKLDWRKIILWLRLGGKPLRRLLSQRGNSLLQAGNAGRTSARLAQAAASTTAVGTLTMTEYCPNLVKKR